MADERQPINPTLFWQTATDMGMDPDKFRVKYQTDAAFHRLVWLHVAALERIPQLERELKDAALARVAAKHWRERAELVEAALDQCWQLMERSEGRVSEELYAILEPLRTALADAPAPAQEGEGVERDG